MSRKMKRQPVGMIALIVIALVSLGTSWVQAQDLKINTRPLTAREIKEYGLTNTTQTAGGVAVVGLGQPVYLELLVKAGTVVTQAVWSLDAVINLDGDPLASSASIDESPLPPSMPTYDSVDRVAYDLVDRAVIVPDLKGTYQISAQAMTADGTLAASLDVIGSVFIGQKSDACSLCHASKQAPFDGTLHAVALKANINDPNGHFRESCIKCHALGYDTTPGAVNGGFDDVAAAMDPPWEFPVLGTNNWDDLPDDLKLKSNVQCENCHGPAQEHLRSGGDISMIGISMSAGNCGQCHDAPSHHVKNFEWGNSLHGRTEVDRTGSCTACHTAAGFVDANDPGMNEDGEMVPVTASFKEGITCAACHDPHAAGGQVHQLRDIQSVEFGNGDVITEGGAGLVCMSCHKSRRNAEEYVQGNVSRYFGPHHGPQGDMLAGVNAVEYGQDMPTSKHLSVVEESCAQCHMQESPADLPVDAKGKVGGHSFMLGYDDGTNVVHLTETCASCHGEIEDFDFGGEDYNLNGLVEGVQSEIEGLLHEIAMLLPPIGSPDIDQGGLASEFNTQAMKSALYNYLFVEEDGSLGVHNPKYAAALLRSSLADLKGGIDIDCDGLVDQWEIDNFGDITSQSGSDDFDEDGLTNAQEQNLGTDPVLKDTDGDTFWDLAEVQAGSDPLEITSVPTSDMVILPAAEIGYLPQGTGTVVRIQTIDTINGEGWQDLGPAQTNTGSMVYELDSMRGTTNRFYRAIEE